MKNKSKLKKIREKKAGTATVTKEWLPVRAPEPGR